MHSATKRTLIAAAALAAAALFGSLPYHGPSQAQGVPTQHHDVALVDADATLLLRPRPRSTTHSATISWGPTGAEEQLFSCVVNGARRSHGDHPAGCHRRQPHLQRRLQRRRERGFEALFLEGLAGEDQLNQVLGLTATDSQTELLSVFNTDFVPIPASADLTAADLDAAVGSSAFDTDLTTIANADYALAAGDFEGYLTSLAGDTSSLGDFSTLLTDLGSSFSDLSTNLTTDFTAVITDITSLLGGAM